MMYLPSSLPIITSDGQDVALASHDGDMLFMRGASLEHCHLQYQMPRPKVWYEERDYGNQYELSPAPKLRLSLEIVAPYGEHHAGAGPRAARRMLPACQLTIRELLQIVHEKTVADTPERISR